MRGWVKIRRRLMLTGKNSLLFGNRGAAHRANCLDGLRREGNKILGWLIIYS